MMNTKQALKEAAKASKTKGTQYVVYVPDDGTYVYDSEQMRKWAPLVFVEAVFVAGVQINSTEAA